MIWPAAVRPPDFLPGPHGLPSLEIPLRPGFDIISSFHRSSPTSGLLVVDFNKLLMVGPKVEKIPLRSSDFR